MSLWVAEHGKIFRGQDSHVRENGNLQLAQDDFESILSLLEDSEQTNLDPILKYSRSNGRDLLTVQQYVGVVYTKSGCQVEILPKISKETTADQARETLVKMLVELRDSPFRRGVVSNLDAHRMPLFELLMRHFLDCVGEIVRKGIARAYVDQQDNLTFLRGKLLLADHIKRNSADKSHVFCEFDEFEIDRPINRLIKAALETISKTSLDAINQQLCREFLFWFDRVLATQDIASDFRSVQHDRLIQHYQPALPTCRLILEGLNPLTKQGKNEALSVLFPMSTVFENYVAAKLRPESAGWKVRSQVQSYSLVEKHRDSSIFQLKPDLEFSRGPHRLIGDTKWKLIDQNDRSNNYKISQADIYQLFAYAKKYLANQAIKQAILIYPRTDRFHEPLEPFWYRTDDEVLYVLPYDLEQDALITGEDLAPFDFGIPLKSGVAA